MDTSEIFQCLCGFELILKNENKLYMVDAKGILTKRNKKSAVLGELEPKNNILNIKIKTIISTRDYRRDLHERFEYYANALCGHLNEIVK